jgi:hypothetical protein
MINKDEDMMDSHTTGELFIELNARLSIIIIMIPTKGDVVALIER